MPVLHPLARQPVLSGWLDCSIANKIQGRAGLLGWEHQGWLGPAFSGESLGGKKSKRSAKKEDETRLVQLVG